MFSARPEQHEMWDDFSSATKPGDTVFLCEELNFQLIFAAFLTMAIKSRGSVPLVLFHRVVLGAPAALWDSSRFMGVFVTHPTVLQTRCLSVVTILYHGDNRRPQRYASFNAVFMSDVSLIGVKVVMITRL